MAGKWQTKKPGSPAFQRIYSLGDERVDELKERLSSGESPNQLAELVQGVWGQCLDTSDKALSRQLARFRKDVVNRELVESIQEEAGGQVHKLRQRLDVMEELTDACLIQKDRMLKVYGKEKQGPLLMSQVSSEIKTYKDLLCALGSLQLETGLMRRAPKTVTGVLAQEVRDEHQRGVLAIRWTEETEAALRDIEEEFDVQLTG